MYLYLLGIIIVIVYYNFVNIVFFLFDVYFRLFKKVRDDELLRKNIRVIEKKIYVEYDIIYKDKDYKMLLVSDTNQDLYNELVELKNDYSNHILKKNKIVYASINDENDKMLIDITDEIRKFCFYFDRQKHMEYFFIYLQDYLGKNNIREHYLKIYKNDDDFSEVIYKVSDISKMDFCKIVS